MTKIRSGKQGRSWRHVDLLLHRLDAKIEAKAKEWLNPDFVVVPNKDALFAASNLDGLDETSACDLLTTHARALYEAAVYLNPSFASRSRLDPPADTGFCALCWRVTVRRRNSRKFFCSRHRPSATNKEYLRHRAARNFRVMTSDSSKSLCFYVQFREIKAAVATSRRQYVNGSGNAAKGISNGATLREILSHLPGVRHLIGDVNTLSEESVLHKLNEDTEIDDEIRRAAYQSILTDQYEFIDMLVKAEAWTRTVALYENSVIRIRP